MEIDPSAVVRKRAALVTLGGTDYRIEARSAAEWLMPILEGDWSTIVPGMVDAPDGGDLEDLFDHLTDGTIGHEECQSAARDALTAVAGIKWWAAVKLIHAAARDPGAFGELRLSGIDIETAPLGAVIAALYRIYTRDRAEKDVTKFDNALMETPAGVSAEERYDEQAATDAFEDLFASRRR